MKLKNNETGIAHVAVIVAMVVLVAISIVGWKVWGSQKATKVSPATSSNKAQTVEVTPMQTQNKLTTSKNDYYTIALPENWKLSSEKPQNVSYDDAFTYADDSGKKLLVYVNIGNVGGAGDTIIEYKVTNNKISLDIDDLKWGDCSSDATCSIGDGKLHVMSSSSEKIKSNNYLFDYQDDKTESTSSLMIMKTLIESMVF